MAEPKRYWWLKLQKDFFKSKRIKKLRSIAGGDTYTIIYLKMQLLSLQDEGYLYFDKVEDTFAEEIALDIDEKPDDVAITIQYLLSRDLLTMIDENTYELPFVKGNIGSETQSAVRQRNSRENRKLLQSCDNVTQLSQNCHGEKEKELEIDKDNNICASKKHDAQDLFEKLWSMYPKKKGKGQVSNAAKGRLLKIGYEELTRAIERYIAYMNGKDIQYMQNGSTFFNSGYVDYLDENFEHPTTITSQQGISETAKKLLSSNLVADYDDDEMID